MGIISIIIGLVICAIGIFQEPAYIFQQTAQINIVIVGSLFICTGMILIGIKSLEKRLMNFTTYKNEKEANDSRVWICEKCETENSGDICKNCGAKKSKIIV